MIFTVKGKPSMMVSAKSCMWRVIQITLVEVGGTTPTLDALVLDWDAGSVVENGEMEGSPNVQASIALLTAGVM